jgi:hypothetical protein
MTCANGGRDLSRHPSAGGDNSASVRDPFGHIWVMLTWKEDLSAAEIERRALLAFK